MKSFEEQLAKANIENQQTTEAVKKLSSAAELLFSDAKENRVAVDTIKPTTKAETLDKDTITSSMDALSSKEGKGRKESLIALDRLKEISVEINALDDGELKDALLAQHKILKEGFDKQASLLNVGFDSLKSSFGDLGMTMSGAIGSTSPLAGFMVGMVTNQIKSMMVARKQRIDEKKEAALLLSAQKEEKAAALGTDTKVFTEPKKSTATNNVTNKKTKVGITPKANPMTGLFDGIKTMIGTVMFALKRFLLIPMLIAAAVGLLFVGLMALVKPFRAEIESAFEWIGEKFNLLMNVPIEAFDQFKTGIVDGFTYIKDVFGDIFKNIGALLPDWAQSLLGINPNTDGADGAIRTDSVVVDYAFQQGKEAVTGAFGWISDKAASITKDLGFVSNDSAKLNSSDVLIESNNNVIEENRKSQKNMLSNATSVNAVKQNNTTVNNSQNVNLMQPNLVHNEPSIMRLTSTQSL